MHPLLIKLDHIGDMALALPACFDMALSSESGKIDLVVAPVNLGWKEVLPWVAEISSIQFPGYQSGRGYKGSRLRTLWDLFVLAIRLRAHRYDVAIDLRTFPSDWRGKLICWLSGAKVRIGDSGTGEWLLTHRCSKISVHQGDILRDCVESYFGILESSSSPITSIRRVRSSDGRTRLVFHPGAGFESKMWPEMHWVELRKLLSRQHPEMEVVWLGGEKERALLERITALVDKNDPWIVSSSIKETLQILADADLLVGLDSAAPHMAALVNTPVVTIFSAANEVERWKALGRNKVLYHPIECSPCYLKVCKWPDHPCMTNISPESVLEAIREMVKS